MRYKVGLLSVALLAHPAAAEIPPVIGAGKRLAATLPQLGGFEASRPWMQWAMGYLTGMSMAFYSTSQNGGTTTDFSHKLERYSPQDVADMVAEVCAAYPDKELSSVLVDVAEHISQSRSPASEISHEGHALLDRALVRPPPFPPKRQASACSTCPFAGAA